MTGLGLDPRYDDASNPDWYCVHGQYTGNSWGADFLCGMCEDGLTQVIACADCGFTTWGKYDEKFSSCDPNPKRVELAKGFRKARNEYIAAGSYTRLSSMLRQAITLQQKDPYMGKRIHNVTESA